SDEEPVVGIEVHLVHAHFMLLATADEARVEDQEASPGYRVVDGGIVSRRAVPTARRLRFTAGRQKLVSTHQLHAVRRDRGVVEQASGGTGDGGEIRARGVDVRTVG